MPPLVTTNAQIFCAHGGRVVLTPRQSTVTIEGGAVLCEPDLIGAPIVGCTQVPSPSTKPCTTVVSTLPGSSSPTIAVAGRAVYVQTLSGLTDGVPPGAIAVVSPGQTRVSA
ncbi:MAG TPA: hypothetical protein VK919_00130 [Solirubrobacterales bacterium]|nr:hypothetical protein [Solirubrobacterales bacterium]